MLMEYCANHIKTIENKTLCKNNIKYSHCYVKNEISTIPNFLKEIQTAAGEVYKEMCADQLGKHCVMKHSRTHSERNWKTNTQ